MIRDIVTENTLLLLKRLKQRDASKNFAKTYFLLNVLLFFDAIFGF